MLAADARPASAAAPDEPVAATPLPEPAAPGVPDAAAPAGRQWDYAVLPLIYYQPETSFGAGGQLALVRIPSTGGAEQKRHDMLLLGATATWKRQYGVSIAANKYWNGDDDRLRLDAVAQRFPNTFWGLGNQTPEDAADSYTPVLLGAQTNYSHRLVEQIYGGIGLTAGHYRMATFTPGGTVAEFLATRRAEGWLVGVGPSLQRDSRDDSSYPRGGSLSVLSLTAFRPAWLSDYSFLDVTADQRTFIGLPRGHVLALQAFGEWTTGEPPIELLPALGGPERLRGYFQGRYRDKMYVMTQAEWRAPLFWRLSGALFAAAGDVFAGPSDIGAGHIKAGAGGGLRLNVGKPLPLNIRLDVAYAAGSVGVYLVIGEAI